MRTKPNQRPPRKFARELFPYVVLRAWAARCQQGPTKVCYHISHVRWDSRDDEEGTFVAMLDRDEKRDLIASQDVERVVRLMSNGLIVTGQANFVAVFGPKGEEWRFFERETWGGVHEGNVSNTPLWML